MPSKIELPKATQEALARALSRYLKDQLDVQVEGFDAVFLLDFITEQMGPHFYNQGLQDAQTILQAKLEQITEAIWEIEKPALTR